jgi:MFS family permease
LKNRYYKWLVLLAVGIVSGTTGANSLAITPILGNMANDLGISVPAAQSSFLGIFLFLVAIACLLSGALADRYGMMTMLVVAHVSGTIPNLLYPFVGQFFGWVVVLRVVQGFAAGAVFALIPLCAAHWFDEDEKGRVVGIGMTMLNAGMMAGIVGSPYLLQAVGNWRATMGWIGVVEIFLFVYVLYIVLGYKAHEPVRPALKADLENGAGWQSLKGALHNPTTYIGVFICLLISWHLNTLNDLTPQYFAIDPPIGVGFGAITAGQIMFAVQIGVVLGGVGGGFLLDKVFKGNPKPVLLIGFLLDSLAIYCILFPAVYGNMVVLMTVMFVAGFTVAFLNPAAAAFIAQAYPERIVGRIVGLWLGIGAFGGGLGIFASAYALHLTGTFKLTIMLFAIVGLLGIVLSQLLRKNIPQDLSALEAVRS